jgi:hypothetical protein
MNKHQLFVKLYPEMLARSDSVGAFVKKVWELVGGGKQLGIAYDQVVHPPFLNPSRLPLREQFVARLSIPPLHLHRDPLWRLSRYLRDT